MPRHNFQPLRGRLLELQITSEAAGDNMLGDPSTRRVSVYLPPSYELEEERRFPLLVVLAAFTGSGLKLLNWNSFDETLPQRVERLITSGEMPPCVVAMPDCFTSLGGNQYINTPVLGRWSDFIYEDLLPALARELRVLDEPQHRAILGHSSGGYGALIHVMRHGEAWAAAACHSGDIGFDLLYRPDLPKAVRALSKYEGDHQAFLTALAEAPKIRGDEFYAMMLLAMAASYDPRDDAPLGMRLPVDLHSCELDPEAWARWLSHDPLVLAQSEAAQHKLRDLRALHIDCGSFDEYNLHFGSRRLHAALSAAKIDHDYEEFPDGHSKVAYRLDLSLPKLARAIAPES
jgi:enterochelin esterase-like enzyme